MVKVMFSASGYGSKTESYRTREKAVKAIEEDAAEVAAEHCGEVEVHIYKIVAILVSPGNAYNSCRI